MTALIAMIWSSTPFLGSGTTALAAASAGRRCAGLDINGHYVDLAVTRLAEATGETPIHESGRTFDEMRESRLQEEEYYDG